VGLKVVALMLHGIGYALIITVAFIYVDSVADKEIKASAQALVTFVLFGLGMFISSKFAGWVKDTFTESVGDKLVTNWTPVFAIPCVLLVASAIALLLFFRDPTKKEAA
jgi:MFS family permease